ncbi:MAG: response regulator transcription factor [Acidimicrobiia bacterium]|nr:response regulator transcription factor [Acidimicrobiia bacterium]
MRILVVEDERSMAKSLQKGLESEGFAVDVSFDGQDGLWHAREHPYDAIVLDLLLPEMNGYEVCRALRDEENWTPILMLTAKSGEFDVAEGLDTGADDYLTKPFSFVVLLARLRALARRGTAERPASLAHGGVVLEPAVRTVTLGGDLVELTSKEFAVLHFLMRRAGEVIAKTEIVENVWDFEFEGDLNIVEVYVRSLRKKLGADRIETIRGAGYRFRADDDPRTDADAGMPAGR